MNITVETLVNAPIDQQRDGWQAILNKFAKHVQTV
jgi:hypothetical protein